MDKKRQRKIDEKEKERELKERAEQSAAGEQLDLIDVAPENLKKIIPVARAYRKVVKERVEFTNRETALKNELLNLIKEAKLKRLSNGKIRFKSEGLTITVTPTDEKISIKEEKDKKNGPDID